MNIQEIKLMVENGGAKLNKKHLDFLFDHIEKTNNALKRISKISKLNNSMNHDFIIIHDLAETFVIKD